MKAKEYLEQIHECETKINQLNNQMEGISITMKEIKSVDLERIHAPGIECSGIIDRIIKLNEIAEDIIKEKVDHQATIDKIRKEIHSLPNIKQVDLLYKRYVEKKKLDLIADEMGYSYDDIRREHGRALEEFEQTIIKKK